MKSKRRVLVIRILHFTTVLVTVAPPQKIIARHRWANIVYYGQTALWNERSVGIAQRFYKPLKHRTTNNLRQTSRKTEWITGIHYVEISTAVRRTRGQDSRRDLWPQMKWRQSNILQPRAPLQSYFSGGSVISSRMSSQWSRQGPGAKGAQMESNGSGEVRN